MLLVAVMAGHAWADEPPALIKARALYNAGDFDGAILAAAVSRRAESSADASALVIARAHLERYRRQAGAADLADARAALTSIRVAALGPRDQVDLFVGLGQSLYLGERYGAAAELFDVALSRAWMLDTRDRLLLLDWWATALDREAQTRAAAARTRLFVRIVNRMEEELRQDPANAPANYWLAASARGAGDLDRAWDAAVAGWVRATLDPAVSTTLRTDLDRLVVQALIPEQVRGRPTRDQPELETALKAEWELVKQQWK